MPTAAVTVTFRLTARMAKAIRRFRELQRSLGQLERQVRTFNATTAQAGHHLRAYDRRRQRALARSRRNTANHPRRRHGRR